MIKLFKQLVAIPILAVGMLVPCVGMKIHCGKVWDWACGTNDFSD